MNIQRITLTRIETIEIAVPFACDADTRANIEEVMNSPAQGNLGDARLIPVVRHVGPWRCEKSDPAFRAQPVETQLATRRAAPRKSSRRGR